MKPTNLDAEMKGVFDRADELAKELEAEYMASAECAVVTERAKNLFHEVLVKIRSSLDFVMYRIYRKYSSYQGEKKVKKERHAGFPICDKETVFNKKLKDLGLSHLETETPELYAKLRQPQPFMTKSKTLLILRDLSNLGKHVKLAKHDVKLQPAKKATGPYGVMVMSEGAVFKNGGKPVDNSPDWEVQNIIWQTISVYNESDEISTPDIFCRALCQDNRNYVESLLPLI